LGINDLRTDLLHRAKVNQHDFAVFSTTDQIGGFDVTMDDVLLMDKR
jgi:hypothetical protein